MQVACGAEHAALVTACGNVWTWGSNDHGQLGVSTAGGGTAALGNEWVDVTPSDSPLGLPTRVSGMGDACVAVACGACHTLMLTRAGRVYSSFALSQGAWPTNTFVGGQDTLNGGGGGVRLVDGTGVVTQVWWCVFVSMPGSALWNWPVLTLPNARAHALVSVWMLAKKGGSLGAHLHQQIAAGRHFSAAVTRASCCERVTERAAAEDWHRLRSAPNAVTYVSRFCCTIRVSKAV